MVPFSPNSLQTEDFRQYRAEPPFYSKSYDVFSAPAFYTGNVGSRWDSGQAHLCPFRDETYYDSGATHYTSYFGVSQGFTQPTYPNGVLQEIKCENFETSNNSFEYGTSCPMPSLVHGVVDVELSSEPSRGTTSPNSTMSGSDAGSVGFATEEQLCNLSNVELDNTPSKPAAPHPTIFTNQNLLKMTGSDLRIGKTGRGRILTSVEKDLERRRKNNEASRKSRAQRKDRFLMDVREVEFLKVENQRLKDFLTELELVIKEANDTLIAKFQYQLPATTSSIL